MFWFVKSFLVAISGHSTQTRMLNMSFRLLYPRSTEGRMGYTGFSPMSVRPSVCRQLGFRNFLKKAFNLMGWVSWPLYIFVFLASFSWRIPTCVAHDCKIEIFIGYFWMRWVVIRGGVYCPHLWAQLVDSRYFWSRDNFEQIIGFLYFGRVDDPDL